MLILPFKLIEVFPQVKRKSTNPKKHFRANKINIFWERKFNFFFFFFLTKDMSMIDQRLRA
jgi:hypothetical protein